MKRSDYRQKEGPVITNPLETQPSQEHTFAGDVIRVMMVDDHSLVRQGLRVVLEEEPDIQLVGEADSGSKAVALGEELNPHVILLDMTLPDANGLEVLRQLKGVCPEAAIIVLTIHDSEVYLVEAISAGAAGYLLKDSPHRLVALAIRTVVSSGCLLEKRMVQKLMRALPTLHKDHTPHSPDNVHRLNDRELTILRMITRGSSNRTIAQHMHLAEATIKKYVHSLKSKLNVNDRAEAAVMGLRLGLVD